MGIFETLLGVPKAVETVGEVVKGGMGMLDNAFYTEQEKAANATKVMDVWLKLQMIWANDNSVAAIMRRFVALFVIGAFVFLVVFAAMIWKVDKEWSAFILKIIIDGYLGWAVVAIITCLFGFYGVGKYVSKENVPFSTASIDAGPQPADPNRPETKKETFPETPGKTEP